MGLRIFDSLTRRKEEFTPLTPGEVRMCGVTVYDPTPQALAALFDLARLLSTERDRVVQGTAGADGFAIGVEELGGAAAARLRRSRQAAARTAADECGSRRYARRHELEGSLVKRGA